MAEVLGSGLHFKLKVSSLLAVRVGLTSAIDVGQAVDEPFDIHPFFEAGFGDFGLVEILSGFDLVPIEADENIARDTLFAVGAAAFMPEGTIATELGRETEISATFAFSQVTVGGGLVVGTGQG